MLLRGVGVTVLLAEVGNSLPLRIYNFWGDESTTTLRSHKKINHGSFSVYKEKERRSGEFLDLRSKGELLEYQPKSDLVFGPAAADTRLVARVEPVSLWWRLGEQLFAISQDSRCISNTIGWRVECMDPDISPSFTNLSVETLFFCALLSNDNKCPEAWLKGTCFDPWKRVVSLEQRITLDTRSQKPMMEMKTHSAPTLIGCDAGELVVSFANAMWGLEEDFVVLIEDLECVDHWSIRVRCENLDEVLLYELLTPASSPFEFSGHLGRQNSCTAVRFHAQCWISRTGLKSRTFLIRAESWIEKSADWNLNDSHELALNRDRRGL
eukprot:Gregarina_sp_Poly_1__7465@NODE_415_length_8738_cov_104_165725_g337_i0_p3_GENE_NODE_415_length_8738_cov_104_165725_g337_i0NODE_415_length_8738_cov_104_165725_g337_i0_p3_ORF_typecomplete_len324_score28_80_NODE_415_length_8738_cov_104_165725_g337_i068197790